MSIVGIGGSQTVGSSWDFTHISPAQVQQASQQLEQEGILTPDEAGALSGMANATDWLPIGGWNAQTIAQFNNVTMQTPTDYLSVLQNRVTNDQEVGLVGEGQQTAAVDASLYQKISAYQEQEQSGGQVNLTT